MTTNCTSLVNKSFILPLLPDPGNDAHTLREGAQPNRQGADQDQPTLGRRDNFPGGFPWRFKAKQGGE